MNLLIASATPFEITPLEEHLRMNFETMGSASYRFGNLHVSLLITGVGLPLTAYAMGHVLATNPFDLAINAGVGGAFKRELEIGAVVEVVSERFGDLGVEEADGRFTDIHQLGLVEPDQFPFSQGQLMNPQAEEHTFLPKVHGISVNKVHGYPPNIEKIRQQYDAEVETMEGAAFFYACLMAQLPFFEIRSISNYVEARNRDNWNLPLAIERLNTVLIDIVESLH